LAAKERFPEVIKVVEDGVGFDGRRPQLVPSKTLEELTELIFATQRKPGCLVKRGGVVVECHRYIPEHTNHLHAIVVVPQVDTDSATGSCDPSHLPNGKFRVWDKIECNAAHNNVERVRNERQRLCIADAEIDTSR
jgi:hypothetical protein